MRYKLLFAVAALAVGLPAAGGEQVVTLDTQASAATFMLGATLHDVHGTLALRSGEIRFDPQTGTASGEVLLDATLTETGNAKRDKKMHTKVLESDQYPTIVFEPERIEGELSGSGPSELDLQGTVEIHGDRHPLVLHAVVDVSGEQLTGTTHFVVPYVEWGMKDPSVFLLRVKKQVEVTIDIVGRVTHPR
jgi:polyisoprenoid-binding protein YceI